MRTNVLLLLFCIASATAEDTLPRLSGPAPSTFEQMWEGFDPRAEPLETEILKEWEEDGTILKVVRFRIGVFKGRKSLLAAVYGFPQGTKRHSLPGLVQIHGGGQYADHRACVANAKRGYATVSLAWAGRISAPDYQVSPSEVQLFWDGKKGDPRYRVTTDWGAVDGYHAPGRNAGNHFPSAKSAAWTLDDVESPRNSGWFLCALAARRALTFLERQPEVDPDRLGVYGHSMGGKLTVMAAVDKRVKAAAPSCGGISDRDNKSALFRSTIGDEVSLKQIDCPIMFQSPSNDFHGRIGDLPTALSEIRSDEWRVTCSPHHNHQDTPEYEAASILWFDQHLRHDFKWPTTPDTSLLLKTEDGIPVLTIRPDDSRRIVTVDVYYSTQGAFYDQPGQQLNSRYRFWHHAGGTRTEDSWTATLPLETTDAPLWIFANVRYALDHPVAGAGYYYGHYETDVVNLTSRLMKVSAEDLSAANVRATLTPTQLIEKFDGDWEKEWFTYRPKEWARTTNKLNAGRWDPREGSVLSLRLVASQSNTLVIRLDDYVAEVQLSGGRREQAVVLKPADFHDFNDQSLKDFGGVRQLSISALERVRPPRGQQGQVRTFGAAWKGPAPEFHRLEWKSADSE